MLLVNHEVANLEIREHREGGPPLEARPAQGPPPGAEELFLGEKDQPEGRDPEPLGALADQDAQPLRASQRHAVGGLEAVLPEDLLQAVGLGLVLNHQADPKAFAEPLDELSGQLAELSAEAPDRPRIEGEAPRRGIRRSDGQEPQLHPLPPGQELGERDRGRRLVPRGLQEGRVVQDHRRVCAEVRQQRGPDALSAGQRQHLDGLEPLERPLGGGIEETDRLDLVAEELHAHRPLARGGEDVHDPAAEAPLPHLHDRFHPLVPRGLQALQQLVARQLPSRGDAEREAAEVLGRRKRRGQPRGKRDDGQRLSAEQAVADPRPLPRLFPLGTAPPERGLPRLKLGDEVRRGPDGCSEKAEVPAHPVERGAVGDQDQRRTARFLEERRGHQRARRSPEAVHAKTGISLGEGPGQRLKRGPAGEQEDLDGHNHEKHLTNTIVTPLRQRSAFERGLRRDPRHVKWRGCP